VEGARGKGGGAAGVPVGGCVRGRLDVTCVQVCRCEKGCACICVCASTFNTIVSPDMHVSPDRPSVTCMRTNAGIIARITNTCCAGLSDGQLKALCKTVLTTVTGT